MNQRVDWVDMQSINNELIVKTIMALIEQNRDSEDLAHFNGIGDINMESARIWTNYMATFGGKILKYAKGFAAMRGSGVIEEEDRKRAMKFHESTFDKYIMSDK